MTQKSENGRRRKGAAPTNMTPMNSMLPTAGTTGGDVLALLLEGNDRPGFDRIMSIIDEAVAPKPHLSHGFVRVATGSPEIEVGNCAFNTKRIVAMMKKAQRKKVNILLLPELIVTGYTAADLFLQEPLRRSALASLEVIRMATKTVFKGLIAVGCPVELEGTIYNCAVMMQNGEFLGVVPKSYLPTYGEFDEYRWFKVARTFAKRNINLNGSDVPMGVDLLFQASDFPGLILGVEICEDGWAVIPPHRLQALGGAVIFLNLSASNELAGKDDYRREHLVKPHSSQAMGAYLYASTGEGESTTDMVPGGHCMIGENGGLLAEIEPFAQKEPFCCADVDVDHLLFERIRNSTFREQQEHFKALIDFRRVSFVSGATTPPADLTRFIDAYPFVPQDAATRDKRCKLITEIQVRGLKKRLTTLSKRYGSIEKMVEYLVANDKPLCVLGVSGGLDSTHALNIVIRTLDEMGVPRSLLHGYTMPGFGTTKRTYNNAWELMKLTGITCKEVDIRSRCLIAWLEEGYKPFGIDLKALRARCQGLVKAKMDAGEDADLVAVMLEEFGKMLLDLPSGSKDLVFENKQARARTDILMNAGFVIGTGDLSELAVGWCTYNGDHMAMYGVNGGIPKTLVHFLVKWAAEAWFKGRLSKVLIDVAETEVSPELLPAGKDGQIVQKTNSSIGPADLRDFFFYHQRRWGTSPEKIVYLASFAKFHTPYTAKEIRYWLKVYITRFFEQRFKHSTLPDGPKVGSVSLSPRYDWHMPSDASAAMWLAWVKAEDATL